MSKLPCALLLVLFGNSLASAGLFITQYYEGPGTNKWIELSNTGGTSFDLSSVTVGLWTNANAEGYKSNTAPTQNLNLSGSLAAGGSFLLGNSANTTPPYATANLANNSVINFNGNDSVAIYSTGTFSTANLLDAIGFTNSGNEGQDKSFVRLTAAPGFDLVGGSNAINFASVWQNTVLAVVDNAVAGTDARLGFSSVSAVPEPPTMLLVSLTCASGWILRRRKT